MFRPTRIAGPAERPVSLELCKKHGVVDHNDDDELMLGYVQAAIDRVDGFAGLLRRCVVSQEWQVEFAHWASVDVLPVPDVTAVSILYDDTDGIEQTVSGVRFHAVPTGARLALPEGFSSPELSSATIAPIRVRFTAGWSDARSVPWLIKVAIMEMARLMYDGRAGADLRAAERKLEQYRWHII